MPMQLYPAFIARRYLQPTRRNRFLNFISLIAVLGIMFGTAALLISMSILEGFDQTLRANMIAFMGHIEVTSFTSKPLRGYEDVVRSLPQREPEVTALSPFVQREAIVRSRAGLEGVLLRGVRSDIDVSAIRSKVVRGSFDFARDADSIPPIVLGERLASRLKLKLGDTVVVFSPNGVPSPDNPPAIEQFRLYGIYRTGMVEYDDIYTYTSLAAAQRFLDYAPDEVSGYDILVKHIDRVEKTARELDTVLGYPHYPRTVFDVFQSIFAWLDLQRKPIPIVLALIIVVAAFNIVSTLLMVVLEKTESIGVLSTLGARPAGIMGVFVSQGLLIGGVGTVLGVLLSLGFTLVQMKYKLIHLDADTYFIDAVPVALVAWHYVLVVSVAVVLCVLSTIIPAFVASRLRPVEALRFR